MKHFVSSSSLVLGKHEWCFCSFYSILLGQERITMILNVPEKYYFIPWHTTFFSMTCANFFLRENLLHASHPDLKGHRLNLRSVNLIKSNVATLREHYSTHVTFFHISYCAFTIILVSTSFSYFHPCFSHTWGILRGVHIVHGYSFTIIFANWPLVCLRTTLIYLGLLNAD